MDLASNFSVAHERIRQACERAGRDPAEVMLLAVSKGHGPKLVQEAVDLGQVWFGENKIQEAKAKIPGCPGAARWHFIGHLQTNKCKDAVPMFEMLHSVDSMRLACEINKVADRLGKSMPVLLEVNVAGESSKFGFSPREMLASLEELNDLPRLELHGFMTMAPWSQDAEKSRPVFRKLREAKEAAEQVLGAPLPQLSMGMSGDFEVAIEEGSTIVRLGTSLFGPRTWKPSLRS